MTTFLLSVESPSTLSSISTFCPFTSISLFNSFGFIDSPGAGNHTYKLQFGGAGNTFRIYVCDGTHYYSASGGFNPSTDLTLFEIDP